MISHIPHQDRKLILDKAEAHAFNKAELYYNDLGYRGFQKYKNINSGYRLFVLPLVLFSCMMAALAGSLLPLELTCCREEDNTVNLYV